MEFIKREQGRKIVKRLREHVHVFPWETFPHLKELRHVILGIFSADQMVIWLRSDLVPEHGARERFLMGTNVNTPFFQVPTPKFGHRHEYKVSTCTQALNWASTYRVPSV